MCQKARKHYRRLVKNNNENRQLDSREINPETNANYGQNSSEGNCSAEINRLSSELNSRLSRELDEMMSSVNTQIQKAISDAIGNQIIPQIQTVLNAGSGQMIENRWNVPSERPEVYPEETYGEKVKTTNRNDQRFDYQNSSQPNLRAHNSRLRKKRLIMKGGPFALSLHWPDLA